MIKKNSIFGCDYEPGVELNLFVVNVYVILTRLTTQPIRLLVCNQMTSFMQKSEAFPQPRREEGCEGGSVDMGRRINLRSVSLGWPE